MEDDYARYLWDGKIFATTGNPYGQPPASFFDAQSIEPAFAVLLDTIGYPDIATVYGPIAETFFLLCYAIAPASLLFLKTALVACNLASLYFLARIAKHLNIPVQRALLLFFWNPLLIFETSFNAHFESLGIVLALIAVQSFLLHRHVLLGVSLALAVGTKIIALLLVPFLFTQGIIRKAASFSVMLAAIYLPFLLLEGSAGLNTTVLFLKEWEFNSTLIAFISLFVSFENARIAGFILFAICSTAMYLKKDSNGFLKMDIVFGLFFLCSAVANPWYLLWLLPFASLKPRAWSLTALAVVSLSYCHGHFYDPSLLPFHHPVWVRPVEIGLITIGVLVDCLRKRDSN